MKNRQNSQQHSIPTVTLYGESSEWPTPDLLYYEPLSARSQQHDFEIRPHRHSRMAQLFFISSGAGVAQLDGQELALQAPCLLWIPEMCVHAFNWNEQVGGHVLLIAAPMLEKFSKLAQINFAVAPVSIPVVQAEERNYLEHLFTSIEREQAALQNNRSLVFESLANLLLVWVTRHLRPLERTELAPTKAARHLSRYSRLVEQQFRHVGTVQEYAEQLGVTAAHLNLLCKQMLNKSALKVVHERRLLEAKRLLIYTQLSASEIAFRVGFTEPAYFSRFFKRESGDSPQAFRKRQMQ